MKKIYVAVFALFLYTGGVFALSPVNPNTTIPTAGFIEALEQDDVVYHDSDASVADGQMTEARATTNMPNLRLFATCSATTGTAGDRIPEARSPANDLFGDNCWCKLQNEEKISDWIYFGNRFESPFDCANWCANNCALNLAMGTGSFSKTALEYLKE